MREIVTEKNMSGWRVMVVDDHALYREATIRFLEGQGPYVVVGTAADGDEALAKAPALVPDVILVDLSMPVRSGLETIPELRRLLPGAGIVVLSIADDPAYHAAAAAAGADAFVSKPQAADELLPVLGRVTATLDPARPVYP